MTLFGYARVSSDDQSLDIQREKLTAYGCQRILEEKVSGGSMDGREALAMILSIIGKGDTLVVTKTDRLGRDLLDMAKVSKDLEQRGAGLVSIDENIDTRTEAGRLYFHLMAVFGEQERRRIRARCAEGIAKAKAAGKYKGRKRKVTAEAVSRLQAEGLGASEIGRELGCSRHAVYRSGGFVKPEASICANGAQT